MDIFVYLMSLITININKRIENAEKSVHVLVISTNSFISKLLDIEFFKFNSNKGIRILLEIVYEILRLLLAEYEMTFKTEI